MNQALNYSQFQNVTRLDAWQEKKKRIEAAFDTAYDCLITHLVQACGDLTVEMCEGLSVAVQQAVEQAVANGAPAPEFSAFQAGIRYYEAMKFGPDSAA